MTSSPESSSDSPCPNKSVCGSCKWSHIPYEKQLQQKLSDINGSMKLHHVDLECTEIIPAPRTEHYRNRMDFAIDYQGKVGLREKGKWWRVLDGHHCFISDEKIEELFHAVRNWTKEADLSFFDRKAHTGLLRYAVIRSSALGETLLSIITSEPQDSEEEGKTKEAIQKLAEGIPETHVVWSIAHTVSDVSRGETIIPIQHSPYITEQILDFKYLVHPFTFFQTNSSGAERLLETVMEMAHGLSGERFIDLYCGSGFFTIPLSLQFQHTLGVEIEVEAIDRAKENMALNSGSIEFVASKTEDYDWTKNKADLLLVDPPRAGLHDKVIEQLKGVDIPNLIYVSCNYKALARELHLLRDHYEVESIKAIDMFPHTPHVEVVTKLRKL